MNEIEKLKYVRTRNILKRKLQKATNLKNSSIKSNDYENAAKYRDIEVSIINENKKYLKEEYILLEELKNEMRKKKKDTSNLRETNIIIEYLLKNIKNK